MEFIIENWDMIILSIALIVFAVVSVMCFVKTGKEAMLKSLKEWLVYATTLAEKELGSGTGALKLRYVYDMFLAKFPWLAKMVTFEYFSQLVDTALTDMKELLMSNEAINNYVNK